MMEALWGTFLIVFLAEMGDKTQFVVMAFSMRYPWKSVFLGMTAGIILVHAIAVAAGTVLGGFIPADITRTASGIIFLIFGIWTLWNADDDEEEEVHDSLFGPFLTVAMTFFLGEMGDKTQFAAFTMAADYGSFIPVFIGAVIAMIAADSLGVVAGKLLGRALPARALRILSGLLFLAFGIYTLLSP